MVYNFDNQYNLSVYNYFTYVFNEYKNKTHESNRF